MLMKTLLLALLVPSAMFVPAMAHAEAQAPPFSETFDTAAALEAFTIINNNNDSKTWAWDSSTQAVKYANTWKAADDYLVLPGLKLEGGKLYTLSFDTFRQSSFRNEKVAAYVGTGPTVAQLVTELLPPTDVIACKVDNEKETKALDFTPEASGVYYFAIKACSEASQLNLYVDNVSVTAPKVAEAPGAVADFTVTPAPMGVLKASISFRVPQTTINGNPLEDLEKVEVYRGEALVATVPVQLGATDPYTCTDEASVYGENIYRAVAYNSGGAGYEARATVFIGSDVPQAPASITLKHGQGDGDVVLEWTPPVDDIRGVALDPASLTYTLRHTRPSQEWYEDLADGVAGTSYTHTECDADTDQAFYKYSVKAVNQAGESAALFSDMWIPLGRPDAVPFTESFAGGMLEHIFRTKIEEGTGMWGISDDDTQPGMTSVDGDNGFMMCSGGAAGDVGALYSGRIDLAGLANPSLAFFYYNFGSDDTGTIQVLVNTGDGFEPVGSPVVTGSGDEYAWNQAVFSLGEFAGKKIELAFKATLSDYKSVAIDNIRVYSQLAQDLSVIVEAPAKVVAGRECQLKVFVTNDGAGTAGDYTVTIYKDGEPAATLDGSATAPAATDRLTLDLPVSLFEDPGTVAFHAVVGYDADMNPANNTSAAVKTVVLNPNHPAPLALSGQKSADGSVSLAWSAPDLANGPIAPATDTFEAYEPFAVWQAGDWKFVDEDHAAVDGPSDFDIPNVTAGDAASFFVMDTSGEDFRNYGFNAFSGTKVLGAVFNAYGVRNDDWAISPELPGHAQAVTLWARSYSSKYPDSFEILCSTTDREVASFACVARFEEIPSAWKEYAAQLPEGAKYFAIRYISKDAFILMVDDVTFSAAGGTRAAYTVSGYNVYRDMELVGTTDVQTTTYTDTTAPAGKHTYHVSALYASQGEGDPSKPLQVDESSIGEISPAMIDVAGGRGVITVTGADNIAVKVYGTDGRLVAQTMAAGRTCIAVAPGVYIVEAGGVRSKVAVR